MALPPDVPRNRLTTKAPLTQRLVDKLRKEGVLVEVWDAKLANFFLQVRESHMGHRRYAAKEQPENLMKSTIPYRNATPVLESKPGLFAPKTSRPLARAIRQLHCLCNTLEA